MSAYMGKKNVRLSCTVSPLIAAYVDELLRRGLYGSTRTEIVRRLLCAGLMESLSGETINRIVEQHRKAKD